MKGALKPFLGDCECNLPFGAAWFFVEGNIHQQENIKKQNSSYSKPDINFLNKVLQINNCHFSNYPFPIIILADVVESVSSPERVADGNSVYKPFKRSAA